MLVAVISKKSGSKRKSDLGAGQDTVLTIFDMSKSYGDLIQSALDQVDVKVAQMRNEYSFEALAQGYNEQVASWRDTLSSKNDGGVSWANDASRDGIRMIEHSTKGTQYVMGVVVASKVLELDENRPNPTNKRGPKNETTAVKNELRKLASGWRMVSLTENAMIYTGEDARDLLATI